MASVARRTPICSWLRSADSSWDRSHPGSSRGALGKEIGSGSRRLGQTLRCLAASPRPRRSRLPNTVLLPSVGSDSRQETANPGRLLRCRSQPGSNQSDCALGFGLCRDASGARPLLHARSEEPGADTDRQLRPADGAIGAHMDAVRRCREDFEQLARTILRQADRERHASRQETGSAFNPR